MIKIILRICLICFIMTITLFRLSSQNAEWVFNLSGNIEDISYRMAVDPDGNPVITGAFKGSVDFDPGPGSYMLTSSGLKDIFIAKYSASGSLVWASRLGGTSDDIGFGIAVDQVSGNIYVCGSMQSASAMIRLNSVAKDSFDRGYTDIFFASYNPDGSLNWIKTITGTFFNVANSCTIDPNHNLLVTGYFTGPEVDFDPGPGTAILNGHGNLGNIFIARYDSEGNYLSAFGIGGTLFDAGQDVCVDNENNIYLCGNISSQNVDFDPGPDTFTLSPSGTSDAFLSSYDPDGNFRWAFNTRCNGSAMAGRVLVDKDGNLLLSGTFTGMLDADPGIGEEWIGSFGMRDVFYGKYSSDAQYLWAYKIGSLAEDYVYDMATDNQGSVYLCGNFRSASNDFDPGPVQVTLSYNANSDIFFARYNSDGSYNWARSIHGPENETAYGIKLGFSNVVYLCGSFFGQSVDFCPWATSILLNSSAESQDVFLGKYLQSDNGIVEILPGQSLCIYPNPVSQVLRVECLELSGSTGEKIIITDLMGKDIKEVKITKSLNHVDVSDLSKGVYFVRVLLDGQQAGIRKIVKM